MGMSNIFLLAWRYCSRQGSWRCRASGSKILRRGLACDYFRRTWVGVVFTPLTSPLPRSDCMSTEVGSYFLVGRQDMTTTMQMHKFSPIGFSFLKEYEVHRGCEHNAAPSLAWQKIPAIRTSAENLRSAASKTSKNYKKARQVKDAG